MKDTLICYQCDNEYSINGDYGVYTSDGAFICNACASKLYELNEEQYEN